jgi:dipeptidyl aminopeptidase/acylaminoacyl peptidase
MNRTRTTALAIFSLSLAVAACGGAPGEGATGPNGEVGDTHVADSGQPAAGKKKSSWKPYDAVKLIPRDKLFGNPVKAGPSISPDGKRLAYVAPQDGVLNVWVKTIGKEDDKVLTADKVRGIRQYFWAENGTHIIYLQDAGGDENWHAYSIPAAGGTAVDLTPVKGAQAQILGVEKSDPNHILVGLNDRDPQYHDVYKVDIRSAKRTLVLKNDVKAVGFAVDHKLRVRVAQVFTPAGTFEIMHREGDKGAWKKIATWGPEDSFTSGLSGFAGDNRTLYVISTVGSNAGELRGVDTRTGKEKTVAGDPEADVSQIMVSPVDHKVQAVGFGRARLEWKALDAKVEKDLAVLKQVADADINVVSADRADKTWIVRFDDDNKPPRYYTYDRKSQKASFLFSVQPELEDAPLAEMQAVSYKARDGLVIQAYLTLPQGVPARKLPVVIHPHGGPWARDTWGFDPTVQWLANRGYAVLQPNFRGSTGYGKKFLNAADREWGNKMQHDLTDGTKWLVDQGVADPDRICIMGGSYGGYATLMGLVNDPDLYACGVDIVGVANLITWLKTIPPYWMPFRDVLAQRVGDPDKDAEFLKSRSPVYLTDKIKAPLLIGQGANDPRVPRAESIQIRDAMKKAGKKVEYIEYADEGHGFARPENRLNFFAAAEKFLAEHIGGRSE